MDKIKRIKELTEQLQKASYAYYGQDHPIMSDKEYDNLYDELSALEIETECILAGSPTQGTGICIRRIQQNRTFKTNVKCK